MNADIQAGILPNQFCARSNTAGDPAFAEIVEDLRAVMENYPLDLQCPFEGVPTIYGGIWKASESEDSRDALLKLRFQVGTMDLPLHSHEHSDRVIFVVEGSGTFTVAANGRSTEQLNPIEVNKGDALVFARGTVHTFEVPSTELVLLSYHSPFFPLEDPRQYTVATEH